MNELSERSKKVGKLAYWKAFEYAERPDNGVLEIAELIEQALLAERRLAMETMAIWFLTTGHEQQAEWYSDEVANALRAAAWDAAICERCGRAEGELDEPCVPSVATPRGGE